MEKIRVGLIGAGFIGVSHANAIETVIEEGLIAAEFSAVCDANPERARNIANSFGARRHCNDPVELMDSGEVNTIFICTPTKFHPELVEAAAKRRLNIFCEKPLACSFVEAKKMHSAVLRLKVKNQVGLVLRYSPVYNVIQQLISNTELGRPMSVIFRDDQYFPISGIYGSTWRREVDMAGGGALIEHSIHDADIMRWLFGEVESVRGTVKNYAGYEGVEDLASAQFQFRSGCIGHLISIWHNILRRESNRYMEIFFENGYISSDSDFIGSVNYQTGNEELSVIPEREVLERYLSSTGLNKPKYNSLHSAQGMQDYHFLRALESGVSPGPDFGTAVKAHEIVEAIYLAARNGLDTKLPLQIEKMGR